MQRFWGLGCVLLLVAGCGAESAKSTRSASHYADAPKSEAEETRNNLDDEVLTLHNFHEGAAPPAGGAGVQGENVGNAGAAVPAKRKIIYNATLNLVVKDFGAIEEAIPQLVQKFEGYIASASVDRSQGRWLSGRWTVRIPVARYGDFLDEATALGIAERREQTAEDVTEEYVDLEARIANKRKLEERILALLEEKSGEIKDVIEVERELARVREEVERMQGRLEFLKNRTALTTVTLNVREERDYVPPQAPTFTGRIASVWFGSLEALRKAGEAFVLIVVALFPWAVIAALVLVPFTLLVRRRFRQHRAASAT